MKLLRIASESYDITKSKGFEKGIFSSNNPKNVFEEVHYLQPLSPENEMEKTRQQGCFYFYCTPKVKNIFKKIPMLYWVGEGLSLCLTWFHLAKKGIRIVQEKKVQGIRTNEALLWFGTLAVFISWRTKAPFAISIHANLENDKYLPTFKARMLHRIKNHPWLAKLIFKRAKLFYAYSDLLADYAIRHGVKKENIRRIYILPPHLSSFQKQRQPDPAYFTLLFIGMLRPQKNVMCLLKALHEAQKAIPCLRLYIIGEGPDKQRLQEFVNHHQLNRVQFIGMVSNSEIPDIMARCDAFVHPSRNEGFSNTILEAQVMGLPIISSDIPEKEESINRENALLFRDDDDKDCTRCIIELYFDKEKQKALSEASLQSAQKYFEAKPEESNARIFTELCTDKTSVQQREEKVKT